MVRFGGKIDPHSETANDIIVIVLELRLIGMRRLNAKPGTKIFFFKYYAFIYFLYHYGILYW